MNAVDQIGQLGITIPWPLQSHLELAAIPSAVSSARLHARKMLAEWGLNGQADIELIVTELVTNAVSASVALISPVRMWLCSDRGQVLVQVWDGCEAMPVRRDPELSAEGARGLLIVDAISEDWGSYRPAPGLSGKVTWALCTAGVT